MIDRGGIRLMAGVPQLFCSAASVNAFLLQETAPKF